MYLLVGVAEAIPPSCFSSCCCLPAVGPGGLRWGFFFFGWGSWLIGLRFVFGAWGRGLGASVRADVQMCVCAWLAVGVFTHGMVYLECAVVQFSRMMLVGVWLGLCLVLFSFFDHSIQSSVFTATHDARGCLDFLGHSFLSSILYSKFSVSASLADMQTTFSSVQFSSRGLPRFIGGIYLVTGLFLTTPLHGGVRGS